MNEASWEMTDQFSERIKEVSKPMISLPESGLTRLNSNIGTQAGQLSGVEKY